MAEANSNKPDQNNSDGGRRRSSFHFRCIIGKPIHLTTELVIAIDEIVMARIQPKICDVGTIELSSLE